MDVKIDVNITTSVLLIWDCCFLCTCTKQCTL